MDIEEIKQSFKTPQVKVRRRTSFFNLEESSEGNSSRIRTEYIEKLTSESQDWVALIQVNKSRFSLIFLTTRL